MAPLDALPSAQLTLAPTLDLCAAAALAGELSGLRGQPLELDASEVQRIGGQCLQVLLSARATWAADNQALTISRPSSAFAEGVALLGAPALDHVPTT